MSQPIIIVTGANGQLGNECLDAASREPQWNITGIGREELDLEHLGDIEEIMDDYKPDIIINCAAYTAVDKAETERKKASLINSEAPAHLAAWCSKNKALLIHISTDYVFSGASNIPYSENDTTDPVNYYGQSKLQGEKNKLEEDKNADILRTSWVYSEYGHNFVKTMLRLAAENGSVKVVKDQYGSPTYAHDLAEGIFNVIRKYISNDFDKTSVGGTYHFTNSGITNWHDFAKKIFELSETNCVLSPIPTAAFPTPAKRPEYSSLDTSKYRSTFNWEIPHWEDALRRCLRNMNMS